MDEKIMITGEDGQARECICLLDFEDRKTGKSYLLYTDASRDEIGNYKVFFSSYDPEDPSHRLMPVETEAEWNLARDLLERFQDPRMDAFDNVLSVD